MFKQYCTGCGLCSSIEKYEVQVDDKGFRKIENEDGKDIVLKNLCPAGGKQCSYMEQGNIWGKSVGVYLSHSLDPDIRYRASSGGVLTALALFLIEKRYVDGVIQVKQDDENPIETVVTCSKTRAEVLKCLGSRYSSSMPLGNISDYIGDGKKYAFIGKPCDVITLRNYLRMNPEIEWQFPYILSFFCAGAPSRNANLKLLKKLGCTKENCVSLKYRGDGWPGYATATDKYGNVSKITYNEAWRDTLGRDIRPICRFCLDGIGEMADISCGDAWHLNENKKPIFEESEGRNVVFCRTESGLKLFEDAQNKGYISKVEYKNYGEEMKFYQAYQYERRAAMSTVFLAMKLMGKEVPAYDKRLMRSYAKYLPAKRKLVRFRGTLKRILGGKI